MSKDTIDLALTLTAAAPPLPMTAYDRAWFDVSNELAALAAMLRARFPAPFGEATRAQLDALIDLAYALRLLRG